MNYGIRLSVLEERAQLMTDLEVGPFLYHAECR